MRISSLFSRFSAFELVAFFYFWVQKYKSTNGFPDPAECLSAFCFLFSIDVVVVAVFLQPTNNKNDALYCKSAAVHTRPAPPPRWKNTPNRPLLQHSICCNSVGETQQKKSGGKE